MRRPIPIHLAPDELVVIDTIATTLGVSRSLVLRAFAALGAEQFSAAPEELRPRLPVYEYGRGVARRRPVAAGAE